MDYTFTEAVAAADEDGYSISEKGLDRIFDVFEHLAHGGSIYDFATNSSEEVVALLAVVWVETREAVLSRAL